MSQTENDEFITLDFFLEQYPDLTDSDNARLLLIIQQANRDLTAELSSAVDNPNLKGTKHFNFAQGVAFLKAEAHYNRRILKNFDDARELEKQYEKDFAKLVARIRHKDSPRHFASTTYEDDLISVHSQDRGIGEL